MEGHAKICVERFCGLANKNAEQLHKVSTPCMDDHNFKKEEVDTVGELSKVCSNIVLKCLYLAHTDRPGILWLGAVTKWIRAYGKRLALFDLLHSSHE